MPSSPTAETAGRHRPGGTAREALTGSAVRVGRPVEQVGAAGLPTSKALCSACSKATRKIMLLLLLNTAEVVLTRAADTPSSMRAAAATLQRPSHRAGSPSRCVPSR